MNPKIQKVIDSVLAAYGCGWNDIMRKSKKALGAEARGCVCWLGIDCAGASAREIASLLGMSANSVRTSKRMLRDIASVDASVSRRIANVCERLKA